HFFYLYPHPRDIHSFPTRRSSDLVPTESTLPVSVRCTTSGSTLTAPTGVAHAAARSATHPTRDRRAHPRPCAIVEVVTEARHRRSEEHTSELQSRGQLVCRLLLEK